MRAGSRAFLGIDLTSSEASPTAYAVLAPALTIVACGWAKTDADIVDITISLRPSVTAIDAPLNLPQGYCCLEEGCVCSTAAIVKGRACERELAQRGIGCFFTTPRSIIKPMVYRGISLRHTLEARGYPVLEVYPYASKVRLFGKPIPKKTTPEGLRFLREHLGSLIPDALSLPPNLSHDLWDALTAAYTAYLHSQGLTEALGDPEEGLLHIPVSPTSTTM